MIVDRMQAGQPVSQPTHNSAGPTNAPSREANELQMTVAQHLRQMCNEIHTPHREIIMMSIKEDKTVLTISQERIEDYDVAMNIARRTEQRRITEGPRVAIPCVS